MAEWRIAEIKLGVQGIQASYSFASKLYLCVIYLNFKLQL